MHGVTKKRRNYVTLSKWGNVAFCNIMRLTMWGNFRCQTKTTLLGYRFTFPK